METLLIQSRRKPEMIAIEQAEYRRALGPLVTLTSLSALDESLPWHSPQELLNKTQLIILGGSGEFDLDGGRDENDPARTTAHTIQSRLRPLIEYIVEHDKPTFGVCFGHQLIGNVSGGALQNDHAQKKIGTHDIDVHTTDELLSHVPTQFAAQYGHKDSLTKLPHGAQLLAKAPNCSFAALRYGTNVYTTQFHPELTKDDVVRRLENTPGYLPEGVSVHSVVRESPEASTLLERFVERHLTA